MRRVIDAVMYLTFHKYPALDVFLSQELCVVRFPLYDVPSAKKDLAKKSHGNPDIVTIFESASEYPTQSSRLQVDAYLAAQNTGAFEVAFENENDFAAFLLVESLILSWTFANTVCIKIHILQKPFTTSESQTDSSSIQGSQRL